MQEVNGAQESKMRKILYNEGSLIIGIISFTGMVIFGFLRPYTELKAEMGLVKQQMNYQQDANADLANTVSQLQKEVRTLSDSIIELNTILSKK